MGSGWGDEEGIVTEVPCLIARNLAADQRLYELDGLFGSRVIIRFGLYFDTDRTIKRYLLQSAYDGGEIEVSQARRQPIAVREVDVSQIASGPDNALFDRAFFNVHVKEIRKDTDRR